MNGDKLVVFEQRQLCRRQQFDHSNSVFSMTCWPTEVFKVDFAWLARTRGHQLVYLYLGTDVQLNWKIELQLSDRPKSCSALSVLGLQKALSGTSVQQQGKISFWQAPQQWGIVLSTGQHSWI